MKFLALELELDLVLLLEVYWLGKDHLDKLLEVDWLDKFLLYQLHILEMVDSVVGVHYNTVHMHYHSFQLKLNLKIKCFSFFCLKVFLIQLLCLYVLSVIGKIFDSL